ncbi:Uncharacterized protein BP5553_05544 [Venustampulla echinocandica]|uniref:EamA domain-containing protein n=1 Tax=Venustampulla echinocandica TaxID=2656787 RepID=A0A370TRG1_9HELO|nr:Uncharacterized protein BP5553_05544 [Venustampulla echinocandica]RDL38111.1 Uncharacterized protein BP5553_05544 [Venustampulla echinocandica]
MSPSPSDVSPPPYTPQPYHHRPTIPREEQEHDDILESLQNIPSNFDLALNGGTNVRLLSPNYAKRTDPSLLDPEEFRRLSIGTASSINSQSRGASPYPASNDARTRPKGFKNACKHFWHRNQGPFLVAFSQFFGALMNVAARLLELEGEGMHPLQVLFARMSLTMLFCCAWMWWKKVPDFPFGAKNIRWLLAARGFVGFFGIYGMYYSLQYLPLSDAVVLTFLAPSVASYACYLFLKEPFTRSAQMASLVSLFGVILIARPTSFFASTPESSPSGTHAGNSTAAADSPNSGFPTPTSAQRLSAVAVAMLGVLGAAGAFTTIRWIGKRAHPLISVNYFAVFCTIISTFFLTLAQPLHLSDSLSFRLPTSLRQWSMLIFLGICGFIMQFLLTLGLAAGGRKNGSKSTSMVYTNMLFALALDKMVFGQTPDWWSLGGSALILASAVFVAMQKQQMDTGTRVVDEEADRHVGEREVSGDEETQEEEVGLLRAREGVEIEEEGDGQQPETMELRSFTRSD